MPEGAEAPVTRLRREQALADTSAWVGNLPGPSRLLSSAELASYVGRGFVAGWRLQVVFPDRQRLLDILVEQRFPRAPARIALVDAPAFLTWPHIERDGLLCLLPGGGEVSHSAPTAVVANLIGEACKLIEDCIAGRNELDLRAEFLSYWGWSLTSGGPIIYSLVDPEAPSREIRIWYGRRFYLFSETEPDAISWLSHTSRGPQQRAPTQPAALLWLEQPLLPSEYPQTARDVLTLARMKTERGAEILEKVATACPDRILVLVGAPSPNGPCLAAVTLTPPTIGHAGVKSAANGISRGFRPGKAPQTVLTGRYFGGKLVTRSSVLRVDAAWIHGRGLDSRQPRLRVSQVAVLGCGSVGAPVALRLAQAGVGYVVLVDPEKLTSANVGRHPLGAAYIGENKATGLAMRIKADYPHIAAVSAYPSRWERVATEMPEVLGSCDLIVSTIGDWAAEGALNEWHIAAARRPVIVYGWTEAHACAGHAVAVTPKGGCLQCGFSETGEPLLRVTEWPRGTPLQHEPACAAVFSPYGPVELTHIEALVAELALDCLLGDVSASRHRVWAARHTVLAAAGATWTSAWTSIAGGRAQGGFIEDLAWPITPGCRECTAAVA